MMIRVSSFGCLPLVVALALPAGSRLQAQQKTAEKPKAAPKIITLSGCVVRGETTPGQYTIEDKDVGLRYRLTGTDVRDYIGRRVQLVGGVPSRRLTIAGGLTPNPNVA